jgi:hypothetical protein
MEWEQQAVRARRRDEGRFAYGDAGHVPPHTVGAQPPVLVKITVGVFRMVVYASKSWRLTVQVAGV